MEMFTYTPFKEEEIEPYKDKLWFDSLMFKLNNFLCHFIIFDEKNPQLNAYRKPNSEKGLFYKYPDQTYNLENRLEVSDLHFYKDLDETVIECGTTNQNIKEVIDAWQADKNESNSELLFKILAPVYKGMRKKGYLIFQLWG